jgi:hypothetical protein
MCWVPTASFQIRNYLHEAISNALDSNDQSLMNGTVSMVIERLNMKGETTTEFISLMRLRARLAA